MRRRSGRASIAAAIEAWAPVALSRSATDPAGAWSSASTIPASSSRRAAQSGMARLRSSIVLRYASRSASASAGMGPRDWESK